MTNHKLNVHELKSEDDIVLYKNYMHKIDIEHPFYEPELFIINTFLNDILSYFVLLVNQEPKIIMPFIKRPITIDGKQTNYFDIISPYGYSGPLFQKSIQSAIIIKFWKLVDDWYKENNVITEFIRFNLNDNHVNYNGILLPTLLNVKGEIIDAKLQWKNFKHKVRTNFRKAEENNLVFKCHYNIISPNAIEDFYQIYIHTMQRKGALAEYFFPKLFFVNYCYNNPKNCAISIVYLNQVPISCELILLSKDTLYSFLGGTLSEFFFARPNDYLKIMTINWARDLGFKYYILGGGREDNDSLYKYKKSFFPKDNDVNFVTGRKIIDREIYSDLVNNTLQKHTTLKNLKFASAKYFPEYRIQQNELERLNGPFKTIIDKDEWDIILNEFESYEFYHTYDYHHLSKEKDEKPILIIYKEKDSLIGIPLIIRSIPNSLYNDATSVYGYPGPLIKNIDGGFNINNFSIEFQKYLKDLNLISVFTRLNPFIENQIKILGKLGKIIPLGKIVYIDLTKELVEQRANYSKSTKSRINKARRLCYVKKASSLKDLDIFIDIYYENMKRLNADQEYFFSRDYFMNFYKSNKIETDILIVYENETNEPIAASMFVKSKDVVQFHLSGTKNKYLDIAPSRIFIDEMRIIATNNGYKIFNLGGGLGGKEDSLFEFKASFSKTFKSFSIWQYIVNEKIYNELSNQNKKDLRIEEIDYFPVYRYSKIN